MAVRGFEQDLLPGFVIGGRFRIERMLGRGGMGSVYAALHLQLNQYVALKVLHGDAARDADSVARFNQEAQVVSRLSNPHVVRVFDMGQTPRGEPFLVMELLQGRDLDAIIAEARTLQPQEAINLVVQASIGVATAHAAGLVHRDLKPANLYLARQPDGSEIVKILDFGLTKVMTHGNVGLTQSASSFGTPQYMSPEQIMSAKHVDARCDQHALALILFELLAKRPAYEADTPGAMTVKIVTQKVPSVRSIRPDIPQKLDDVIQKGMAKKPVDRYPNVGAFAQALAPFGWPDAKGLADIVAQQLRASSAFVAVDALPPGNSIPSMSANPTMGSFSSGNLWRGRGSSLYWGVGIGVLVAAAAALTLFLVLRPPAPPTSIASSAGAAEPKPDTTEAAATSDQPIVPAPSTSAVAVASSAPSTAPSTKPSSSGIGSRPTPTPPTTRVIPSTTGHSVPKPANSDPFTVFGGNK